MSTRTLFFTAAALDDLGWWTENDSRKLKRIAEFCLDTCRHPASGLGKPEPLRFQLAGCGSRRIDQEHRLVCRFDDDTVFVLQCRYPYG